MLKQIRTQFNVDYIIQQYNNLNDVPIDSLEVDFYSESLSKSILQGSAWALGEAKIYVCEYPDYHEIVYLNSHEHPADSLKLMAKMALKYPILKLRPLGTYFFGLIFTINVVSAMKYIRGKSHLVNIYYPEILAKQYLEYSSGL